MKIGKISLAFLTTLMLGTAVIQGGCATTGMDRSVKTSNSINDVDREIRKMIVQIDVTAASLDALVVPGQTELKKSFNTFSDNLASLDKEGKLVLKRTEEMKARSTQYFAEWEKEGDAYTNPEMRGLSAERRTKLAEIYARVPEAGYGVKGNYQSYMTGLKDIQKYLSTDLTPKGVESINPIAKKSVQDLDVLKKSLQPVLAALDEIKAELYSDKK
jgi:hypothetical protein